MFDVLHSPPPFPLSLPGRLVSPKPDEGRSRREAGAFQRFSISAFQHFSFQFFPGPDFARSPNRHLFRNFVLTLTRVKVSAGVEIHGPIPPSIWASRLIIPLLSGAVL
jgi:hypothetical protein